MDPWAKDIIEFTELVWEIRRESEYPIETGQHLKRMAELIDKFNNDCCGCGWAGSVSEILSAGGS